MTEGGTQTAAAVEEPPISAWRSGRSLSPLASTLAGSVSIQAANIITGILLARTLGAHGRGVLTAVILWPSLLLTVGSVGVTEAVIFMSARAEIPLRTVIGSMASLAVGQSGILL